MPHNGTEGVRLLNAVAFAGIRHGLGQSSGSISSASAKRSIPRNGVAVPTTSAISASSASTVQKGECACALTPY